MTSELPIVVSGPPVVVTLLTGLLFAFAIQLLMTSFGVAAGVTAIGFLPSSPRSAESPSTESLSTEPASAESPSAEAAGGAVVGMIGFSVGLGMLLTVNFVLFVACFLAVKLSLAEDVAIGAILGLVIWAAYFLILVWLGSSAVGSLLGAIVTTLTAGAQGMIATIKTVFGRQAGDRDPPNAMQPQLDQLQRELETVRSVDRRTLEVQVQDYLQTLDLPKPDFQAIRDEFARVVSDLRGQPDLRGQDSHWPVEVAPFDRQLLIDRLSRHPAFSRQDVDQLVEQLEAVWHEVTEKPRSASDSSGVAPAAIDFRQRNTETAAATSSTATPTQAGRLQDVAKQVMHAVRQRVDWSELDAGTIVQNIQSAVQSNSSHDATRNSSQPDLGQPDLSKLDLVQADSVKADSVKADIEDFLLTA